MFSSPWDSKLTPDGLGVQWNRHHKTFLTITLELLDRNIARVHFKTKRVAETALGASWFWQPSAPFLGTWGIFSTLGYTKLTPDGLGLPWNEHSKTFWTLTFELLRRNIAPLHFKNERVAETALGELVFWLTSNQFTWSWGIFSSPGASNLTPCSLFLQWNGHSKTFWTLTFELVGRNIAKFTLRLKQ